MDSITLPTEGAPRLVPATPILVAIALAFCGVVAALCGWIGQPSLGRPTCRRCGRDVRDLAWDAVPICSCGNALHRDRAVRWLGRQRSLPAVLAGIGLVVASVGLFWADRAMTERAIGWADLLPASSLVGQLQRGENMERATRSLVHRANVDWLGESARAEGLEAILAAKPGSLKSPDEAIVRLLSHPSMLEPERDDLRRAALQQVNAGFGGWRQAPVPEMLYPGMPFPSLAWSTSPLPRGVIMLIDSVSRNGEALSIRLIHSAGFDAAQGDSEDPAPTEGPLRFRCRMTEFHVPRELTEPAARWLLRHDTLPEGLLHETQSTMVEFEIPSGDATPPSSPAEESAP